MTSAWLVPWILAGLACPGQDKQPPPEDSKVKVTVVVILASERCEFIDPRLKDVAVEVQKNNPKLKGFTLVSMTQMSMSAEEKASFACIDDTTVAVVVRNCMDKNGKVCLAVKPPLQDEVVYKTVCGKFLLIVTRYQGREHIPVRWAAVALTQAMAGGPSGPLVAGETLEVARTRDRLIVAIRVLACNGK